MKYLTDISSDLMTVESKLVMLREELSKLNSKLPSNVYIPFVGGQVRSSAVLSIPAGESKIFVTKGKVPYLVAIEIFDPLEIAYDPLIAPPSPKLEPGKLPSPPPPIKDKPKRPSWKGKPKTPDDVLRDGVEKTLDLLYDEKLKSKKPIDEGPVTINQLKKQRSLHSLFFL